MKNLGLLILTLFVSHQAFAIEYSRETVDHIAMSYVAGLNNTSFAAVQQDVDEIVINDSRGTDCYVVEVLMIPGRSLKTSVLIFSQLEVVFDELKPEGKTFDSKTCSLTSNRN